MYKVNIKKPINYNVYHIKNIDYYMLAITKYKHACQF